MKVLNAGEMAKIVNFILCTFYHKLDKINCFLKTKTDKFFSCLIGGKKIQIVPLLYKKGDINLNTVEFLKHERLSYKMTLQHLKMQMKQIKKND